VGEEGTGAATPPENKVNKPSSNLAAWLTFAGAIFGGIVTIVVAIINTNKPGGPEKPTVQSSPTAIAATVPTASAPGGLAAQTPPPAPTEKEQDDAALTKLLIGKWKSKELLAFLWWEGETSYAQSHTFSGIGTFSSVGTVRGSFGSPKSFRLSGSWQIRNKRLYYEMERSDIPNMIPVGLKGANPIIRLTNDELVFEDSVLGGQTRTWQRQEAADN
jgi:hypothetical protein